MWKLDTGTTVHGGYSRYFTPPPFELIGSETFTKFAGTTAVPPGSVTQDTPPIAERANYYDFGVQQKLLDNTLTLGVDSFYEQAQHLIDEGQFGAPIILTPVQLPLRPDRRRGVHRQLLGAQLLRLRATPRSRPRMARTSSPRSSTSMQPQLDYITDNYIHLDHEGRVAASGGVSYLWLGTRFSADMLFGTGLRDDLVLPSGFVIPNGDHTPSYTQFNLGLSHEFHLAGTGPLTVRFDVINVGDKVYQIRSGTGIGVFAPQYGPRRGFFGGLSWEF